jgi:hypothetical protein
MTDSSDQCSDLEKYLAALGDVADELGISPSERDLKNIALMARNWRERAEAAESELSTSSLALWAMGAAGWGAYHCGGLDGAGYWRWVWSEAGAALQGLTSLPTLTTHQCKSTATAPAYDEVLLDVWRAQLRQHKADRKRLAAAPFAGHVTVEVDTSGRPQESSRVSVTMDTLDLDAAELKLVTKSVEFMSWRERAEAAESKLAAMEHLPEMLETVRLDRDSLIRLFEREMADHLRAISVSKDAILVWRAGADVDMRGSLAEHLSRILRRIDAGPLTIIEIPEGTDLSELNEADALKIYQAIGRRFGWPS